VTIRDCLIAYLKSRAALSRPVVSSHNMEDCKKYAENHYDILHNVSSYEREWRKLRAEGIVETLDATIPNSKEKRWWITKINGLK
jgi:hypothetical protein